MGDTMIIDAHDDYEDLAKTLHGRIRGTDQEYIICAANWYKVPTSKSEHLPKNIDYGIVVCGRRHHNIFATVAKISEDFMHDTKGVCEQGFLTSKDRWVDRKDAGLIAYQAGQTTDLRKQLFSEDLY